MALNPRAKMLAAIAATRQNTPTSGGPSGQGEPPSNPPPAPTAGPSQPSGEAVQPTALSSAALLDKANQAVTEAIQKQGPIESVKASVPSLSMAMQRLQVKQQQAQEAPPVVEKEVKVLPTPKDPALKSAAELSIVARAKLLKETGEQYSQCSLILPGPSPTLRTSMLMGTSMT